MDKELKEEYIHAMFRFRKIGMTLPQRADINMTEIIVMKGIAKNSPCSDNNKSACDIQSKLHITKSAISQMMNTLEKKGYIEREIDKADRRKVLATLTPAGEDVLKEAKEHANQLLEEVVSRFGEENTKQFIALLNQLSDIAEKLA